MKIYNEAKTMYLTKEIGPHMNVRFAIYEKTWHGWALRLWTSDKEKAIKRFNEIKDEPIKNRRMSAADALKLWR